MQAANGAWAGEGGYGGTPGYRPLEVVCNVDLVSPAVDVFGAGVIMLQLLTSRTQFFIQQNAIDALNEFIQMFGPTRVKRIARKLGVTISVYNVPALAEAADKVISEASIIKCLRGMNGACNPPGYCGPEKNLKFSIEAFDLVSHMLSLDPAERYTAVTALDHAFFRHLQH